LEFFLKKNIGSSYYVKSFKDQTIVMKELTKTFDRTLESSSTFFNFKNHGYYIKIGYLRNIENQRISWVHTQLIIVAYLTILLKNVEH